LAPSRRDDVALVVTEAVTNAVLHAYPDMEPGPLYVAASVSGRALLVIVCDWGGGMTPDPDRGGLGFGMALTSALADRGEIAPSRSDRGTHVAMLFRDATPGIAAPDVSHPVQATMTARTDTDAVRAYVDALAETSAAIDEDTQALHAEARHAVAQARRLRGQTRQVS